MYYTILYVNKESPDQTAQHFQLKSSVQQIKTVSQMFTLARFITCPAFSCSVPHLVYCNLLYVGVTFIPIILFRHTFLFLLQPLFFHDSNMIILFLYLTCKKTKCIEQSSSHMKSCTVYFYCLL